MRLLLQQVEAELIDVGWSNSESSQHAYHLASVERGVVHHMGYDH